MMINERDRGYLQRIIDYCNRILEAKNRFGDSFESFISDADYRDVVCMNIFQIGELANQISDGTQVLLKEIPWKKMYGIRNILAHAYIKVDDRTVWETIEADIPKLKERLEDYL